MRYRLRTLMFAFALGPPIIGWWARPTIQKLMAQPARPRPLMGGPPIEALLKDYDPSRPLPQSPPVKRLIPREPRGPVTDY